MNMLRNKKSLHKSISRWSLPAALLLSAGCGGSGPAVVPVSGIVTVGDSQPLVKGVIRFTPRGNAKIGGGAAETDDQGKYVMKHQGKPGVEPGDYAVSFSLLKMPDGSPIPDQQGVADPKTPLELGAVDFVPKDYSNPNSEKTSVTVPKEGGKFDFKVPELKAPRPVKAKRR